MIFETSMEWVLQNYPDRIQALFDALDLDRGGLEAVKAAVDRGDMAGACRALLDYYRDGESGKWLRGPSVQPGDGRDEDAENLLGDTFTVWGRTARVPRTSRGGLDWTYGGPDSDINWAWGFNRQEYLPPVLEAYRKTGHARYVRWIDNLIQPSRLNRCNQLLSSLLCKQFKSKRFLEQRFLAEIGAVPAIRAYVLHETMPFACSPQPPLHRSGFRGQRELGGQIEWVVVPLNSSSAVPSRQQASGARPRAVNCWAAKFSA